MHPAQQPATMRRARVGPLAPPHRPSTPRATRRPFLSFVAVADAVRARRPVTVAHASASSPPNEATPATTQCPVCSGSGRIPCPDCQGAGVLGRGGYNRKNPLPKKLVGSKWTAAGREPVLGWRHFVVEEARKGGVGGGGEESSSSPSSSSSSSSAVFVRLRASCDPQARLWVSAQLLRDRARWAAGWLRMDDVVLRVVEEDGEEGAIEEDEGKDPTEEEPKAKRRGGGDNANNNNKKQQKKMVVRGSVGTGAPCRKCSGTGWRPCTGCRGEGRADLIVL